MNQTESTIHRSRYSPQPGTAHASSERMSFEEVGQLRRHLYRAEPLLSILERLPLPVALLNENRQLVYANPALIEWCGSEPGEMLGLRIGEVFGCRYAVGHIGGCGTSTPCRTCGVTNAVLAALGDRAETSDCHIHGGTDEYEAPVRFGIETSPFSYAGRPYVFVLFGRDVHDRPVAKVRSAAGL